MRIYWVVLAGLFITAQHRQVAGGLLKMAYQRQGRGVSEAAADAHMDPAEVTRQLTGEHHVWLDAAVAQGKHVCAQLGYALLEYAEHVPAPLSLQLEAASRARKRMAECSDETAEWKEA